MTVSVALTSLIVSADKLASPGTSRQAVLDVETAVEVQRAFCRLTSEERMPPAAMTTAGTATSRARTKTTMSDFRMMFPFPKPSYMRIMLVGRWTDVVRQFAHG